MISQAITSQHTSVLILAGTLANSGLETKAVKFSTASPISAAACVQATRADFEKFGSTP